MLYNSLSAAEWITDLLLHPYVNFLTSSGLYLQRANNSNDNNTWNKQEEKTASHQFISNVISVTSNHFDNTAKMSFSVWAQHLYHVFTSCVAHCDANIIKHPSIILWQWHYSLSWCNNNSNYTTRCHGWRQEHLNCKRSGRL